MPLSGPDPDMFDHRAEQSHIASIGEVPPLVKEGDDKRRATPPIPPARATDRQSDRREGQTVVQLPKHLIRLPRGRLPVEKADRVQNVKAPHNVFISRHPEKIGVVENEDALFNAAEFISTNSKFTANIIASSATAIPPKPSHQISSIVASFAGLPGTQPKAATVAHN